MHGLLSKALGRVLGSFLPLVYGCLEKEEVNPRLNLTSAVVSSTGDKGGQPSAWGQDWTQTASPVTCHHLAEPSHPWHRVSDKP